MKSTPGGQKDQPLNAEEATCTVYRLLFNIETWGVGFFYLVNVGFDFCVHLPVNHTLSENEPLTGWGGKRSLPCLLQVYHRV